MKAYIKLLALTLVALIGFQIPGFAQVPPSELSVEQVADAFVAAPMDYGLGSYYFTALSGDVFKEIRANFTIQRSGNRWGITQLALDGKELPIDPNHPLWEFPLYMGKVVDFSLNLSGYNKSGKNTRRGFFHKSQLLPGDEIKIHLYLDYVYVEVPFTFTGDQGPHNTGIQDEKGYYGGYYDHSSGAFVVGYDPLRPLPSKWIIYDRRDNSVIGTAPFVPPSVPGQPKDSGLGFSLDLPDDISEISLNRDGWSEGLEGLKMDHIVMRNGTNYYAKVVVVSPRNQSDYVLVYGYGLRVGTILEVYGVTGDGQSKLLQSSVMKEGNWDVRVVDATGYVGYRAVFIGAVTSPIQGFSIYAYNSSWPQGGGDGKGRAEETQ